MTIRTITALLLILATKFAAAATPAARTEEHECFLNTMSCGATITSEITIFGCRYVTSNDTKYWTRYRVNVVGTAATITASVTSTSFIPELGMAEPNSEFYATYNSNASRANTISLTTRVQNPTAIDIDVYAKSPYTGLFRLTVTCDVCNAPVISQHPTSTSVPYNGRATLTATAVGTAPLVYDWYDAASPSTALFRGQQFTTPPITRTSSFYAEASNSCGRTRSLSAVVEPGPCARPNFVTIVPPAATVPSGSSVAFDAVIPAGVAGSVSYQWYEGSPPNTSKPITFATVSRYTVVNAERSAQYWVRVTNECGSSDSTAASLTVIPPSRRRSVKR